ncbi:pre-mRNA splicing factor SR-like 1 isoform X1 [Neltuma alba]|uniref:pre-mRNA splicing factor SR-like 1 isoform X1 n=1 Tax=Neltuma alba TaxID=207710 RepID=UPI0010A38A21|nr:pre-mRNA splicing factor SR-like 1 isoform X1 [Prosopis alba]XP_028800569.1 pre-mRNA splicing factor SR-like 1 isoform X1 [Prosopis alba]
MEIQNCGRPIDSLIEKVLCMNILSSDYFKELYRLKTYHEVIDEIYNQVDHVEPWMTGNCRGPSTSFCLLYKFFTMKLTVKQMHGLLKHPDSPYIRAVGFLYLRYVADPKTLWNWFEPYVKDEEEFSPGSNGRMTTMGVYVRDLLLGQYYFDTLFPRIPVPVMRQVVANLEKLKLPTKHSGSTGESTRHGSDDTARRPPSVKASLSVSFGQRAPHRASTRDSSPVRRTVSHHERNGSDDPRKSPRSGSHSQSHGYSNKDSNRERETFGDQSRARDRDWDHYRVGTGTINQRGAETETMRETVVHTGTGIGTEGIGIGKEIEGIGKERASLIMIMIGGLSTQREVAAGLTTITIVVGVGVEVGAGVKACKLVVLNLNMVSRRSHLHQAIWQNLRISMVMETIVKEIPTWKESLAGLMTAKRLLDSVALPGSIE